MANTIKASYSKELWAYLLLNVLFFVLSAIGIFNLLKWQDLASGLFVRLLCSAGVTLLVPLTLSSILSGHAKAMLVFWRWNYPLPGSEAFTRYLHCDDRIDAALIRSRYGALPVLPREQNVLWYKLYKKYEDKNAVIDGQRSYLLFRDLATLSIGVGTLSALAAIFALASLGLALLWFLVSVAQFLLLSHNARVAGRRFVCTVLAEESASDS